MTEAAESPLLIGQIASDYRILNQLGTSGTRGCTEPKTQVSDDMLR